jgi:thioredoxin-related protein
MAVRTPSLRLFRLFGVIAMGSVWVSGLSWAADLGPARSRFEQKITSSSRFSKPKPVLRSRLSAPVAPARVQINWQKDIFAAHKVSLKTGKPMLFVFGADWCSYCKKLEEYTLSHPEMTQYVNSSFVPVHLDFDRDKRLADILKIDKIPCTVVLSPHADLLSKQFGYLKPVAYHEVLQKAHQLQQKIQQAGMTDSAIRR